MMKKRNKRSNMQPVRYREDKRLSRMMTTTSFCCRQPLRAAAALSRAARAEMPHRKNRTKAAEPYKRPSALPPGIGKISSDAEHPKALIMRKHSKYLIMYKRSKDLIMYKHPDSLAAVCTLPSSPAICGLPK